jgi:manganese efflux pump family protein
VRRPGTGAAEGYLKAAEISAFHQHPKALPSYAMLGSSLLLVAVGLSMDAFAVSVYSGVSSRQRKVSEGLLLALFFGGFQSLMALAGWATGSWAAPFFSAVDHWIAFGLLAAVGVKMIYESFGEVDCQILNPMTLCMVLTLSVATSIDALAVGVSLSFMDPSSILDPVLIIGLTTFLVSLVGVALGRYLGSLAGNRFALLGGIILLAIGTHILVECLFFQ